MNIKQLKSGRWQITYTFNKVKKRKSFDTFNEAKIEELNITILRLGNNNTTKTIDDSKTLVKTCILAWKNWLISRDRSGNYIKRIDVALKNIYPFLEKNNITTVAQLNKQKIDSYFQFRKKQGAKQQTIINEFRNIHAALNWSLSRDMITNNRLAKYKPEPPKHIIPETPNPRELQKIFNNLPNNDARKIFYFILAVGSRFSETAAAKVDDVENKILKFHRETKKGYIRYVKIPKMPFPFPKAGLLFSNHKKKWSNRLLLKYIHNSCIISKVNRINIHTLRHAHATYSLAIGGPGNSLQEIIVRCGWKSLDMLTRYMDKQQTFSVKSYLPKW